MISSLEQLGEVLTTLDVAELTMLPRFTAEDSARWPVVLSERPRVVRCVVAADHDAELSTTIGHPHTGDPQRWLDLCVAHAEALSDRYGYTVDTTQRAVVGEDVVEAPGGGADHPLATVLSDAADGRDARDAPAVTVLDPVPGPCDVVLLLPGRVVVAADLDPDWVRDQHERLLHDHDPTDAVTSWGSFLAAVTARLGRPRAQAGLLTAASHRAPMLRGALTLGGEPDPGWSPYRSAVTTYRYRSNSTAGHIDFGHGPAGRAEVYPRLRSARQSGGGPSREVVAAARSLAPEARHVFGSAPLDDTNAVRVLLDGAFVPVATEVLLLTRPRQPAPAAPAGTTADPVA